jgi:hypothetical protein
MKTQLVVIEPISLFASFESKTVLKISEDQTDYTLVIQSFRLEKSMIWQNSI